MASSDGHGAGVAQTTAAAKDSHAYFFEDEVFTVDKRGRVKFGVIISSGTISDEDDEDYVDPGKVRQPTPRRQGECPASESCESMKII